MEKEKNGKIKRIIKKVMWFFANPRLWLCLGIAWMITNGWSYVMLALGIALDVGWMQAVAGAYLTFLWIPMTPEKIITAIIAIFLLKCFFPRDEKTLKVLTDMRENAKASAKERRRKRKSKGKSNQTSDAVGTACAAPANDVTHSNQTSTEDDRECT